MALALAVGVGVTIARRPDAITYPQLWAEDGQVFFLQAYQMGFWAALIHPHSGYLQTTPRLAVGLALLLPFSRLPLVLNVVGLIIQAAPAAFIMSDRWDLVVPSRVIRGGLGFVYLALPNTAALDATITNAQWHLAVLACLVILAPSVPGRAWRTFDILVTALSGLSGPFAIPLAPCALLLALARRTLHQGTLAVVAVATGGLQGAILLATYLGRMGRGPQGLFQLPVLWRVLAESLVVMPLLGVHETHQLERAGLLTSAPWDATVLLLATAVCLLALARGSIELRAFLFFSGLVMAASLARVAGTLWMLINTNDGQRYFFIPMLGWLVALVYVLARSRRTAVGRVLLLLTLGLILFSAISSWEYAPLPRSHFYQAAALFARARPGQTVAIPENPPRLALRGGQALTRPAPGCP